MKRNITILVDIQEDFIRGALAAQGAVEAIPEMVKLTKEAYSRGDMVVATLDTHTTKDFVEKATLETKVLPPHVILGTKGHRILKELLDVIPQDDDERPMIDKQIKKTFGSYELVNSVSELVNSSLINEINLFGVCTDICVLSNALMLRSACPGIVINVYAKACAGLTKQAHDAALMVMKSNFINIIE